MALQRLHCHVHELQFFLTEDLASTLSLPTYIGQEGVPSQVRTLRCQMQTQTQLQTQHSCRHKAQAHIRILCRAVPNLNQTTNTIAIASRLSALSTTGELTILILIQRSRHPPNLNSTPVPTPYHHPPRIRIDRNAHIFARAPPIPSPSPT